MVVAGAELLTGNGLLATAWASRRLGGLEMGRSWTIAIAGNTVGAIGLAAPVVLGRVGDLEGGAVGARRMAGRPRGRAAVPGGLVPRRLVQRAGLPGGLGGAGRRWRARSRGEIVAPAWTGVIRNLVPVTLGNIAGGAGMVALVYHLVYRRRWPDPARPPGDSRPLDKRPTGG